MFDVEAKQFIFMHGFGYLPMTMDASDKDEKINVKSRWGTTKDQASCIYEQMDYGGGGTCGYAPVIALALNDAAGPVPGWFSGELLIDQTLNSKHDCQALCAAYDGCEYFSYEWENTDGTHYHECFMKAGFMDPACHGWVKWGFSDDYPWFGASGYGVCPDQAPAYGMFMPDVIKSITINGEYYFLTANEGGGRDGEDMLGMAGDLEGEEIKLKDLTSSCGMGDTDCSADEELGRLLTTAYMPSNYATSAAGDNQWPAANVSNPRSKFGDPVYKNDVDCIYEKYDYGGGSGSECGEYATVVAIVLNNESAGFPGWFSGTEIIDEKTLRNASDCQRWCSIYDGCDFFS